MTAQPRSYALAVFATVLWGANAVIARAAATEVTPVLATWLRFVLTACALVLILKGRLLKALPVLRAQWKLLAVMSCGAVGFNCLIFLAARYTGAASIAIFQGAIPLFVVLGAALFLGNVVSLRLVIGVLAGAAGLAGVFGISGAAPAQGGYPWVGDAIALAAMALYAVFVLGVRQRRGVDALVFYGALCVVSCAVSTPLALAELVRTGFAMPTGKGWVLVLLSGLGGTLVAQLSFLHAIDTLGPSRAGLFMNLIPIFGVMFSAALLGESLTVLHAIGLGLILGGIVLVESAPAQPVPASRPFVPNSRTISRNEEHC